MDVSLCTSLFLHPVLLQWAYRGVGWRHKTCCRLSGRCVTFTPLSTTIPAPYTGLVRAIPYRPGPRRTFCLANTFCSATTQQFMRSILCNAEFLDIMLPHTRPPPSWTFFVKLIFLPFFCPTGLFRDAGFAGEIDLYVTLLIVADSAERECATTHPALIGVTLCMLKEALMIRSEIA